MARPWTGWNTPATSSIWHGDEMPHIVVKLAAGRPDEQKARLGRRIVTSARSGGVSSSSDRFSRPITPALMGLERRSAPADRQGARSSLGATRPAVLVEIAS
jgi:hypothetical protein